MSVNIVFVDRASIRADIHIRPPAFAHTWTDHDATSSAQVAERCRAADIIVTNKTPVTRAAIARLPRLKLVAVAATGVDPIDLAACAERGIIISNIRDYALTTVPEHVIALILALRRQIPRYRSEVIRGRWQEEAGFCFFDAPINDVRGAALGLIGFGALGQATARLARHLGMTTRYYSPRPPRAAEAGELATAVDLDTLLADSDVVSCHCPLNDSTRHMINAAALSKMKPGAILINTARGAVVDEHALAQALERGEIAAAGIDVLPREPPAADSPMLRLAGRDNVILTPHIAWASQQAMQTLADQLIDNIEAFTHGRPRHVVG